MNPLAPYTVLNRSTIATTTSDDFPTGSTIIELQTYSVWDLVDGVKPTGAPATIAISAATSMTTHPTRYWSRRPGSGRASYSYITTWYVDPVNGNDANSGEVSNDALASVTELRQRMMNRQYKDTTIRIASDCSDVYRGFPSNFKMTFLGTEVLTGRVASATAAYDAAYGVNESNTLTDNAGLAWAAYIGKYVKMGNFYAAILSDLTGGKARLGQWLNTSGTPNQAAPAAGAYSIVTLPIVSIEAGSNYIPEENVYYKLVSIVPSNFVNFFNLVLCQVDTSNASFFDTSFKVNALGCVIKSLFSTVTINGPGGTLAGSSFIGGNGATIEVNTSVDFSGVTCQKMPPYINCGGTLHNYSHRGPFASFDSANVGAQGGFGVINNGGRCKWALNAHTFFGSGNENFGFAARSGSFTGFAQGFIPTIKATGVGLDWYIPGDVIPKFEADDVVPAAFGSDPTWVNWRDTLGSYAQGLQGAIISAIDVSG